MAAPAHLKDHLQNNIKVPLILFYLGFTARQDYFTHFEPSQALGGAKTGDLEKKPPDHSKAELGLSHIRPELGSKPQR